MTYDLAQPWDQVAIGEVRDVLLLVGQVGEPVDQALQQRPRARVVRGGQHQAATGHEQPRGLRQHDPVFVGVEVLDHLDDGDAVEPTFEVRELAELAQAAELAVRGAVVLPGIGHLVGQDVDAELIREVTRIEHGEERPLRKKRCVPDANGMEVLRGGSLEQRARPVIVRRHQRFQPARDRHDRLHA
ncbi:MAG TPA: hypothetical protein VHT91_24320 [Kofleriaceae bacterium]|jgi:hypothetical protein|nr:hypothetical protein [Kofleriaceae bacterium]